MIRGLSDRRCGQCGTSLRRKYVDGKGNKSRKQHPRQYVCEHGHTCYRKVR